MEDYVHIRQLSRQLASQQPQYTDNPQNICEGVITSAKLQYALTLQYQSKALITTVSSADVMHLSACYYLKYTLRRDYVVLTQNLLHQ